MLKKKNFLRLGVLLVTIILVLINCKVDDHIDNTIVQNNSFNQKKVLHVNVNDIPQIINDLASEQKGYFPKIEKTLTSFEKNSNYINPFGQVDTSVIQAIEDLDGNRTYTFKLNPFDTEPYVFYNLIVVTDSNGTINNTYIKKYSSSNNTKFGTNYSGTVEKYSLEGEFETELIMVNGRMPMPDCIECGDDNNNNGTSNDDGSGGTTNDDTTDDPVGDPINNDTNNGDGGDGGSDGSNFTNIASNCYTTVYTTCCNRTYCDPHMPRGTPLCTGTITYTILHCETSRNPDPIILPCCEDDTVVIDDELITTLNNLLCNDLTQEQEDWVNLTSENTDTAQQIQVFLQSSNSGGCADVDFEEFIYFIGWENLPCQKEIIKEAKSELGDISNSIEFIFGSNPDIHLLYTHAIIPPDPNNPDVAFLAGTTLNFDDSASLQDITITFHTPFLNQATDLGVFTIAIHENLHAILGVLLEVDIINSNSPNSNLAALATEYAERKALIIIDQEAQFDSSDSAFLQHQIMTGLVSIMEENIKAFGESKNYTLPNYIYNSLAWAGLNTTPEFFIEFPDQTTQNSTNDIIDGEIENIQYIANGTPCN